MKWTACQLCKQELKLHERAEGICDACCRKHTAQPYPSGGRSTVGPVDERERP